MRSPIFRGDALSVIVHDADPTAYFAATELAAYMERITGRKLPLTTDDSPQPQGGYIRIGMNTDSQAVNREREQLAYDGFIVTSVGNAAYITSKLARGLLFGVYALLEHWGCRWLYPGPAGERLPSLELELELESVGSEQVHIVQSPHFELRSITDGAPKTAANGWAEEMMELVDWSCKNKLNSISIHNDPCGRYDGIKQVSQAIKLRGMRYEFGGHGIHHQIDRSLYEQNPEPFRMKEGERRKDGNFCVSNAEALGTIVNSARNVLASQPDVDILHLAFDDSYGGSWCECASCAPLSAFQQQLHVINTLAGEVGADYPHLSIDMALYHDTLEFGQQDGIPAAQVLSYFAPRERCYYHSIADESCARNRYYYQKLKETERLFGDNNMVLEYYGDLILYRKMKLHFPQVLAADLKQYYEAGVRKISTLMFGRYSWWSYNYNLYLFARATWDIQYSQENGLADYCQDEYGPYAKQVVDYYNRLEEAAALMLPFCEYNEVYDLRNIPVQSPEFYHQHIGKIQDAIGIYEQCAAMIAPLLEQSSGLAKELEILQITLCEARAVYEQMAGLYEFELSGQTGTEALAARMDRAIGHIRETEVLVAATAEETKGIAGKDIFVNELCHSLIQYIESLKK